MPAPPQRHKPPGDRITDRLAQSALRASVATSPAGALSLIVLGLAGSWLLTYAVGGARAVVPHWYYLPILFTAVRFGPLAALMVALAAALLAGPLTPLDVAAGVPQETGRWLTRAGFFVTVGAAMAALVRPSLPSVAEELRRARTERLLRRALDRGEFMVRYQPVVDLRTGGLHGVEALVRWRHPDLGESAPASFLADAEQCDVIHDLGAFVLAEACRQAVRWRDLRPDHPLTVSVNMSARELEAPGLVARVRDCLAATGIDPALVCLEITESILVEDLDGSLGRLAGLKELGVRLAVDDFGTGYSSLAAVHRYPIDVLKVDRSFVAAIGDDDGIEGLLGGILMLARSLGLTTIAEGIETSAHAEVLGTLGYELGQGYRYGRPLEPPDIEVLLAADPSPTPEPDPDSGVGRRR